MRRFGRVVYKYRAVLHAVNRASPEHRSEACNSLDNDSRGNPELMRAGKGRTHGHAVMRARERCGDLERFTGVRNGQAKIARHLAAEI